MGVRNHSELDPHIGYGDVDSNILKTKTFTSVIEPIGTPPIIIHNVTHDIDIDSIRSYETLIKQGGIMWKANTDLYASSWPASSGTLYTTTISSVAVGFTFNSASSGTFGGQTAYVTITYDSGDDIAG